MALIELERAREAVLAAVCTLPPETVALTDALGRTLAADVVSGLDLPPFDNSAMDGFALRQEDVARASSSDAVSLRVVGESRAGHPARRGLDHREAIVISTGAMMPDGADAVVPVEHAVRGDRHVLLRVAVAAGSNVRRAGEDLRAGQIALRAGSLLGPAQLGVLASLGHTDVSCVRRPRAAVLTTGDELVWPGEPLGGGSIYNANAFSVPALARQAGADIIQLGTVPDEPAATREAIAGALTDADVVVLCGGVSVGEHDHVKRALAELGVQERFWGVALKPGKPTWFGASGQTLVFGLPGNPVSAMVTFTVFVAPAVRALSGACSERRLAVAVLDSACDRAPGRTHLARCRLFLADDGWHATPTGSQGSHVLSSMLDAHALAVIAPGEGSVPAGQRVPIELLDVPGPEDGMVAPLRPRVRRERG